jgi:hypothetical protein
MPTHRHAKSSCQNPLPKTSTSRLSAKDKPLPSACRSNGRERLCRSAAEIRGLLSIRIWKQKSPLCTGRRIAGLAISPFPSDRIHVLPSAEQATKQSNFFVRRWGKAIAGFVSISDAKINWGQVSRIRRSFRSRSFSDRKRPASASAAANRSALFLDSTFRLMPCRNRTTYHAKNRQSNMKTDQRAAARTMRTPREHWRCHK